MATLQPPDDLVPRRMSPRAAVIGQCPTGSKRKGLVHVAIESEAREGDDLEMARKTAAFEALAANAYGDGTISEVIRPAAVLPDEAARSVLAELALRDVRAGGLWLADPTSWRRYTAPWPDGEDAGGQTPLIGGMQIAYGTPTRYEITVYRATVTQNAAAAGWTVTRLCDEAMAFGGLSLDTCPRADLRPPPRPFRLG